MWNPFDTTGFPARWYCGQWSASLGWTHVLADLAVWGAYTAIPIVIAYFVLRRKDIPFPRVFWLFGMFIFACGTVHLTEAIIFWSPIYRFSAGMKVITAVVSWATVVALVPLVPQVIALRSPAELQCEIDERIRAQEALRHAHDQLELRVQERTAELRLTNEQLVEEITHRTRIQAELQRYTNDLERSNQELQEFASVASHDLQEPLRKVQAFSDQVYLDHGEQLGEQGRDYLDRIRNAGQRMSRLIQDLLAYSRIKSRATKRVTVDCQQILNEVVSDLQIRIEETSGKVMATDLPTIEADPTQIRQLLQNLVGNALKYHRAGIPPVVELSCTIRPSELPSLDPDHPNAIATIEIRDNGIGFEEKFAKQIFGVFQRLHSRDQYEGTGIGLAICRRIVERHDGRIWARSQPGIGSVFTIELPLHQSREARG